MHLTNHRIMVVGIDLLELLKYPTVERRASLCVVSSLREERAIESEFKFPYNQESARQLGLRGNKF